MFVENLEETEKRRILLKKYNYLVRMKRLSPPQKFAFVMVDHPFLDYKR
jgi:hypothetical protein